VRSHAIPRNWTVFVIGNGVYTGSMGQECLEREVAGVVLIAP
jgi:hypothetical protein